MARASARPTRLHVNGYLTVDGEEDVQVARHVHPGPDLSRAGLDPEALRYYFASEVFGRRRRCRPQPGRFRRTGEFRHRRQARQPRQPLRRLHRKTLRWPARCGAAGARLVRTFRGKLRVDADAAYARNERPRCCAMSWAWRTKPTATSTSRSRGSSPRTSRKRMRCMPSAPRASICSACWCALLKPVLPRAAGEAETFLDNDIGHWSDVDAPLLATRIAPYTPLLHPHRPRHASPP